MAIYSTPKIAQTVLEYKGKRQATLSDPPSTASDGATSLAAIIDVLQVYGMVATA